MTVKPESPAPSPYLTSILVRLQAGEIFSTADTLKLREDPNIERNLLDSVWTLRSTGRAAGLRLLMELGRPVEPPKGELPAAFAPYIAAPAVVAALARGLSDDAEEVRRVASDALVEQVTDLQLRTHGHDIERVVEERPGIDNAALLLGKVGSDSARRLLLGTSAIRDSSESATQLALAKLGERPAEEAVIAAYQAASPQEKARLARRLGYVGTVRALLTLARDLRNPDSYVWTAGSRRSVRVHVIEGLRTALPTETIFWAPPWKPSHDSYYEQIEAWVTANLGVTWERPRPPFLYEQDAPILPF